MFEGKENNFSVDDHEKPGVGEPMPSSMAEATASAANAIEASGLPPERKSELKGRLQAAALRTARIFAFAAALGGTVGTLDYAMTRYKVSASTAEGATTVYTHEDPETTHVIDMMSGKEHMTETEKENVLRDELKKELMHQKEQPAMNEDALDRMPLEDLYRLASSINVTGLPSDPSEKEVALKSLFKLSLAAADDTPKTFDPQLYGALWKLEQECGSPKIRLQRYTGQDELIAFDSDRIHYSAVTNTLYIHPMTGGTNEIQINQYIQELTHAEQFNSHPVSSSAKFTETMVESLASGVAHPQDFLGELNREYDTSYRKPGTLEHEAHSVIQPKLQSELDKETPERMEALKNAAFEREVNRTTQPLSVAEGKALQEAEARWRVRVGTAKSQDEKTRITEEFDLETNRIAAEFDKKKEVIRKQMEAKRPRE